MAILAKTRDEFGGNAMRAIALAGTGPNVELQAFRFDLPRERFQESRGSFLITIAPTCNFGVHAVAHQQERIGGIGGRTWHEKVGK
jgi:hypothetical protein